MEGDERQNSVPRHLFLGFVEQVLKRFEEEKHQAEAEMASEKTGPRFLLISVAAFRHRAAPSVAKQAGRRGYHRFDKH